MHRVEVVYSVDDYVAAQWLHLRPRPNFKILIGCLVAITLVGLAGMLAQAGSGEQDGVFSVVALAGVVMYLFLMFFVYFPWKWRRNYRQQKTLHHPITVEFDENGYRTQSERGSTLMKWSDFICYKRNENLLLLYQSDVMMNFVPRRHFSSEAAWSDLINLVCHNVASEIK